MGKFFVAQNCSDQGVPLWALVVIVVPWVLVVVVVGAVMTCYFIKGMYDL